MHAALAAFPPQLQAGQRANWPVEMPLPGYSSGTRLVARPRGSMEEKTMQRQIVVVTGASAGTGRATAAAFGKLGWRVALLARGVDGLECARQEVERAGGAAMVIPTDVADPVQVEAAGARIEREWG